MPVRPACRRAWAFLTASQDAVGCSSDTLQKSTLYFSTIFRRVSAMLNSIACHFESNCRLSTSESAFARCEPLQIGERFACFGHPQPPVFAQGHVLDTYRSLQNLVTAEHA
jgi:hypothetical protein